MQEAAEPTLQFETRRMVAALALELPGEVWDDVNGRIESVLGALEEAERGREQLRDALRKFGRHDDNCALYQLKFRARFQDTEPTCLCGYKAALER